MLCFTFYFSNCQIIYEMALNVSRRHKIGFIPESILDILQPLTFAIIISFILK